MKKSLVFVCGLLSLGLFLGSCGADYNANPDADGSVRNPLQGEFTAVINGQPFLGEQKNLVDTGVDAGRTISISGLAYSQDRSPHKTQAITLIAPGYNGGVQFFDMNSLLIGMYTVTDTNWAQVYVPLEFGDTLSYLSIDKADDKSVSGTFSLVLVPEGNHNQGRDTLYITDGAFDIPR